MTTAYTSLLGLALPVTGELSGTWGDTVNNSITSLLDSAIAGTTTLSTDADVTLTTTTGAANTSRQAILLCSGARTVLRTITAPAQSKIYTIINATTGGFSVKLVGVGPTTGVTIVAGESAVCAWNGSDFIKVSNTGGSASFTNVTVTGTTTLSGLTASTALALDASKNVVSVTNTGSGNNVLATSPTLSGTTTIATLNLTNALGTTYGGTGQTSLATGALGYGQGTAAHASLAIGTAGQILTVNSGATAPQWSTLSGVAVTTFSAGTTGFTPSSATSGAVTLAGTLATTNGGTGLTSFTANGVVYASSSSALATGSALTFDGTNLGVGVTPSAWGGGGSIKAMQVKAASIYEYGGYESGYMINSFFDGAFKYIGTAAASKYVQSSGSHAWYSAPSGTAGNAITFTQAMTLFASGALALGTTSDPTGGYFAIGPDSGKTASSLMWLANTGGRLYVGKESSAGGTIVNGTDAYAAVIATSNAYPLQFGTNNAVRATIDSSGNLLVGDSTTIGTGGKFQVNSSTDTSIFKCTAATTYAAIVSNVENTAARLMAFQYGSGGSPTNVGRITTDGTNIAIATVSGITFPATQAASADANTLDDYEEGTFTPTIVGSTSAGTGTYSTQVGTYTRVGRAVSFRLLISWSAHTGTGSMLAGGLPFASSSVTDTLTAITVGGISNVTLSANHVGTALLFTNTTQISFYQTPVGGGSDSTVPVDTSASTVLSGTYFV